MSSFDKMIVDIKKYSRCKNFYTRNLPKLDEILDFKREPKLNFSKEQNYQQAIEFVEDNFNW